MLVVNAQAGLAAGALRRVFAVLDGAVHMPGYTAAPSLSNGGLTYTQPLDTYASAMATVGLASARRYFEVNRDTLGDVLDNTTFGLAEADGTVAVSVTQATSSNDISGFVSDGGGAVNYGGTFDGRWGIAVDFTTGLITVSKNGAQVFARTMGAHGPLYPFIKRAATSGRAVSVETFNFGATAFVHDPGAGWHGWYAES